MAGNRRTYTGYGHMGGGFVASDMALGSMKLPDYDGKIFVGICADGDDQHGTA